MGRTPQNSDPAQVVYFQLTMACITETHTDLNLFFRLDSFHSSSSNNFCIII